jgi:serine phosphatase RsbU (regulator of sigma subunit)
MVLLHGTLDVEVGENILFRARHAVNMGESLHPKIKIFGMDDKTVSKIKKTDLTLEEWGAVLQAIDRSNPRVIIVDKLFDQRSESKEDLESFAKTLKSLKTKIVTGSFSKGSALPIRQPVPIEQPRFDLSRFSAKFSQIQPLNSFQQLSLAHEFNWLPTIGGSLYAADQHLWKSLEIGHFVYHGRGRALPILRMNQRYGVSHIGLTPAKKIQSTRKGLSIDGVEVPLENGRIRVNLQHPETYTKKTYSMAPLIKYALANRSLPIVKPDDVVVILPAIYTGNTDFFDTPWGILPGGYIPISIISSTLDGSWLVPYHFHWLVLLAAVLVGLFLGHRHWANYFLVKLLGVNILLFGGGVLVFCFFGYISPWLTSIGCLCSGAFATYALRIREESIVKARLETEIQVTQAVQNTFFHQPAPMLPGLDIAGKTISASECSGDWWNYFNLFDRYCYVIVGDATGHGLPAAFVTSMAFTTFFNEFNRHISAPPLPSDLIKTFNKVVYAVHEGSIGMTMCVARFDNQSNEMLLSNAGHNFPLLFGQPDGNDPRAKIKKRGYMSIGAAGPILGWREEIELGDVTYELNQNDRVIMFTDGALECPGEIEKEWGRKKFTKNWLKIRSNPPDKALENMCEQLDLHFGKIEADDDITLVVIDKTTSLAPPKESLTEKTG